VKRSSMLWLAALLTAVVGSALAPAALAKDGDVRVRGTCTKASAVKLKLSEEDGRIEVEVEVDQNRNGVRWTVAFTQNGKPLAKRTAVTRPPSGSFELRLLAPDGPGRDVIAAKAASPGGEVCSVRAAF
jgi:hypothetical protein